MSKTTPTMPNAVQVAASSQGAAARRNAMPRTANPHPGGTQEFSAWHYGWDHQPDFDAIEEESEAWFARYAQASPVAQAYMMGVMDADACIPESPEASYSAEQLASYIQGYRKTDEKNEAEPMQNHH